MTPAIDKILFSARELRRTIVFPETDDPRVIEAAQRIATQNLGIPLLIDPPSNVQLPSEVQTISTDDLAVRDACAAQLFENRKHKGLSREAAEIAVTEDRLIFAALLIRIGRADAGVAGSLATTASVIRAGLYGIGTPPTCKLVSSFFLMQLRDGRAVTFADCGVVPDPNAEQLAEIAVTAAENHRRLTNEEPRVAMLSFSTRGSADHPRVDKVRQATQIAQRLRPAMAIDGELQFDAAFVPSVAERKAPNSRVAGQANVFVFPDLDSGNIAYKIAERIGGAAAFGPIVQGLQQPFMDLSRGCSVSDIVNVAAIAACLTQTNR
jgi:phosphate acetyltransferase